MCGCSSRLSERFLRRHRELFGRVCRQLLLDSGMRRRNELGCLVGWELGRPGRFYGPRQRRLGAEGYRRAGIRGFAVDGFGVQVLGIPDLAVLAGCETRTRGESL